MIYKNKIKNLLTISAVDIISFMMFYSSIHTLQTQALLAGLAVINIGALGKAIINGKYDKNALKRISEAICYAFKEKNILNKDSYVAIKEEKGEYEVTLINAMFHLSLTKTKKVLNFSERLMIRINLLQNQKLYIAKAEWEN